MGYEQFSRFYDKLYTINTGSMVFLDQTLRRRDQGYDVLELGCGTGNNLEYVKKRCNFLCGMDQSPEMLAVAGKKLPDAELLIGDMADFRLERTFDAVLVLFDTMNHLQHSEEWISLFDCAVMHLKDEGKLLIDINTPLRLQRYGLLPPVINRIPDGSLMIMQVNETAADRFLFELEIFEHLGNEHFFRIKEEIKEFTPSPSWVLAELQKRFERVSIYNESIEPIENEEAYEAGLNGRLYYAAQKPKLHEAAGSS